MSSTYIHTFKDGLRLAHTQSDNTRSVGIIVLCGVGSQNENSETNGLSHFIEHNVFKGTTTRSPFQIVNELDMLGAQYNAYTSKQQTAFYTISIDTEADKCAEILSDILTNPSFDEKEMENERKVILEEVSMSEDDNEGVCQDLVAEAFYGKDTPLGRTIIGPAKNIKKFTRQDVLDYKSKNYISDDIVISISGHISREDAIKLCEKYFVDRFPSNKNRLWQDDPLKSLNQDYLYKFKDIEQANLFLAMPAIGLKDKRKFAANVALDIFGGGMSSRLFQEVREKHGLAYQVYAYNSSLTNSGITYLYIGTNKDSVEKSLALTKKVIEDVKKNGFTHDEIVKGVNSSVTRFILSNESTVSTMRMAGNAALMSDEAYDLDYCVNQIKALTAKDIQEAFEECVDISKASCAYVGREINADLMSVIKS